MLDEIKKSYYEHANAIKDWKNKSGNDLCFIYIKYKEENNPNLDNCLSGIIYKFWNIAVKAYHSQGIKLASPEDCYNWLIDSIQYVLEHHVWTDPKHQLYNDAKAPEKAINVVFNSTKINYFVALTRQKRKVDSTSLSLEGISEDVSDSYFLPVYDNYNIIEDRLTDIVIKLYNSYKYFCSICFDLMINEDVVEASNNYKIKYKKLKHRLKSLDDNYAKLFSTIYNIDYEDVKKSVRYISTLNPVSIDTKLNQFINELKRNQYLLDILKDE